MAVVLISIKINKIIKNNLNFVSYNKLPGTGHGCGTKL
jgi:hypothetical protein